METEDPDIVQQLRIMIQYTNAVAGSICSKAADEIERLRKEVEKWKFLASEESSNQGF